AKLSDCLLHFRIVGVRGAELKRVRLLDEQQMLDAHRSFGGVVKARRKFGAGIAGVGTFHAEEECGSGLRSERVIVFLALLCLGLLRGRRRRIRRRLRVQTAHAGKENKRGPGGTQRDNGRSIHRFSSFVFFSSMDSIIRISARCELSASVAKLNSSASCPAPAVSNKSFTMVSAPLWC